MVPEFVKLISEHENVFEIPVNGVGSDVNWVDRIIGGMSYFVSSSLMSELTHKL